MHGVSSPRVKFRCSKAANTNRVGDAAIIERDGFSSVRGIPIELYFFCALKDWVPYEGVQADVFDHVLAIIPEFDLQVFQSPSGRDFQRVLPAASEEKGA